MDGSPLAAQPHLPAHSKGKGKGKQKRRLRASNADADGAEAFEEGEEEEEQKRRMTASPLPPSAVAVEMGDWGAASASASSASASTSASASASASSSPPLRASASLTSLSSQLRALMLDAAVDSEAEEKAEMLDYDAAEDAISSHQPHSRPHAGTQHSRATSEAAEYLHNLITETLRILITAAVGVSIGLMGYAIALTVRALISFNVRALELLMTRDLPITAFFSTLSFSLAFTALAALSVTVGSWHVKGSGVGKLNAFLSGVSSARSLTLRTLLCKVVGLVCSVSAGLKLGMEGPFIHLGAMMGLHISHLLLFIFRILLHPFRLHRHLSSISGVGDERMFISGGAAAGFSVAFNAPIAGLLYVQDGASAYWNGDYTFRSFVCTMTAVTTINLCYAVSQGSGSLPSRGLIDLEDQPTVTLHIAEFWGFAVLGVMGGLLGALFTSINVACEKRRLFYLGQKRVVRVVDTLVCSMGGVLLSFSLPFLFPCTSVVEQCTSHSLRCLRFQCGPSQSSELATLFFTLPEESIRILFDRHISEADSVSAAVLLLFCLTYFAMAALSYGAAVPGGLFIPSIIIGASYGRVVGMLASSLLPPDASGIPVNPGVYAVLGAASMLGGVTRMTLPISVMMIEITSDAQFLIPIMLVVVVAKVVADQCIGALYAEHLRMDGLVMVFGDRLPRSLRRMKAREMMNRGGVVKVSLMETAERVAAVLRDTPHNAFPVVDLDSRMRRGRAQRQSRPLPLHRTASDVREGEDVAVHPEGVGQVLLGLVQRRHLLNALQHPALHAPPSSPTDSRSQAGTEERRSGEEWMRLAGGGGRGAGREGGVEVGGAGGGEELGSPTFASTLPSLASLPSLAWSSFPFAFSAAPLPSPPSLPLPPSSSSVLNLSRYVDEGAFMVSEETSARRVWALFRSLGMRHIVVVDRRHQPVGMITRRDLLWHAVADR